MDKNIKHKSLIMAFLLTVALVLASCGSPTPAEEPTPPAPVEELGESSGEEADDELPVFTLEELAEYNGKDGRPAYVAVEGLVYDFTQLGRWSGGTHNGFEAGQDLTEALRDVSPHGDRVLDRAPVVGVLEE